MAAAGCMTAAAQSAFASVSPFIQGAQPPPSLTQSVTGTGGELLADQLIEAGATYMFVSNGSGLGPLCDALVTRPKIQFIQATHEGGRYEGPYEFLGRAGVTTPSRFADAKLEPQ